MCSIPRQLDVELHRENKNVFGVIDTRVCCDKSKTLAAREARNEDNPRARGRRWEREREKKSGEPNENESARRLDRARCRDDKYDNFEFIQSGRTRMNENGEGWWTRE